MDKKEIKKTDTHTTKQLTNAVRALTMLSISKKVFTLNYSPRIIPTSR